MANKTLFKLAGTPVTAEISGLFSPLNVFGVSLWLLGRRPWPARIRLGLWVVLAYEIAAIIHTLGHIYSSRWVGAPMDRVRLAAPLPRTVYEDNGVSPAQHRGRAMGGPVASGLMFLVLLLLRPWVPRRPAWQDFLNTNLILNALLGLGSLAPLPFIDGGVLLKWSLVERGQTEVQADEVVRQANLGLGAVTLVVGLGLALRRKGKAALISLFQAAGFIAAGLGKLSL